MRSSTKLRWVTVAFAATFVAAGVIALKDSTDDPPAPSAVLDLTNWKLQLPIDARDEEGPDEVTQPTLSGYRSDFFHVNHAEDGVVFRVPVGGSVTDGSSFTRTELREMTDHGRNRASWSNDDSVNTMSVRQAVNQLPPARPSIVVGQIHGGEQYGVLVRLDGNRLYVKADDENKGDLDENYQLGTVFTLKLEASHGKVRVYYNDVLKVELEKECEACYFKAGAYLQSNTEWGDRPDAFGEVTIYSLTVRHS